MDKIYNHESGDIVLKIIKIIQKNKDYLSEIDGKIGDGDHGINMNKGFTMCEERLKGETYSLSEGLSILADTLQEDIGGSMGPLYGVFFEEMSDAIEDEIDANVFLNMMDAAIEGIQSIGSAKKGDKTLLDTIIPAGEGFLKEYEHTHSFAEALKAMKTCAEKGWKSTEDMIAKIGRASRLGERSRGVLDAGATSSYLILSALSDSIIEKLNKER